MTEGHKVPFGDVLNFSILARLFNYSEHFAHACVVENIRHTIGLPTFLYTEAITAAFTLIPRVIPTWNNW